MLTMGERTCWREDCTQTRKKWGMCSPHCNDWIIKYPPKKTKLYGQNEMVRFWFYVDQGDVDECWIWRGALNIGGYGVFNLNERDGGGQVKAHRYAYEELRGGIPEEVDDRPAELDHRCRIRPCVNPWHLQVVTQRNNVLLGVGFAAENAQKTHCPNGHPYEGGNLIITSAGWRACRTCIYEKNNAYRSTGEFLKKRRAKYEPITGVRGKGAYQSQKTHCPEGHPYAGDNLIIERRKRRNGDTREVRRCRICVRARQRK